MKCQRCDKDVFPLGINHYCTDCYSDVKREREKYTDETPTTDQRLKGAAVLLAAKDDEILKLRAYAIALEGSVGTVRIYDLRDRLGIDWEAIHTDPRVQTLIDAAFAKELK
mgnify:CR=1 FL=1